jgi:outer membrane protein OmpA-like peptidoglycan-associated protein
MAGGTSSSGSAQTFASTLTDLMTSLAVTFILLLVVFLKQAHDQAQRAKSDVQSQLQTLLQEKNLTLKQDAEDPLTLSVMVGENQLRFPLSSAALSTQGSQFIDQFFKNFSTKLCSGTLKDKVDSIVIEGHTDTSGERNAIGVRNNIALSQKRSYSVLERAMRSLQGDPSTYECFLKLASASGRGSRKPVMVDGVYNADLSRRVEIKIRVRSAEQQFKQLVSSTATN